MVLETFAISDLPGDTLVTSPNVQWRIWSLSYLRTHSHCQCCHCCVLPVALCRVRPRLHQGWATTAHQKGCTHITFPYAGGAAALFPKSEVTFSAGVFQFRALGKCRERYCFKLKIGPLGRQFLTWGPTFLVIWGKACMGDMLCPPWPTLNGSISQRFQRKILSGARFPCSCQEWNLPLWAMVLLMFRAQFVAGMVSLASLKWRAMANKHAWPSFVQRRKVMGQCYQFSSSLRELLCFFWWVKRSQRKWCWTMIFAQGVALKPGTYLSQLMLELTGTKCFNKCCALATSAHPTAGSMRKGEIWGHLDQGKGVEPQYHDSWVSSSQGFWPLISRVGFDIIGKKRLLT